MTESLTHHPGQHMRNEPAVPASNDEIEGAQDLLTKIGDWEQELLRLWPRDTRPDCINAAFDALSDLKGTTERQMESDIEMAQQSAFEARGRR